MGKNFRILNVRTHVWNVVKNNNNVVLLKCTCCQRQRIGVAIQREKVRYYDETKVTSTEYLFWYHGYNYNYAEQMFNELVQRQCNNENDEDYYDDNINDNKNHTTSNNSDKKRSSNNDDNNTLVINNAKIMISNPYFHVRGEKQR
jgi:hypothetical protein